MLVSAVHGHLSRSRGLLAIRNISKACRSAPRGGILVHHTFPAGRRVLLQDSRPTAVIGVGSAPQALRDEDLEVTLNGERVKVSTGSHRPTSSWPSRPDRRPSARHWSVTAPPGPTRSGRPHSPVSSRAEHRDYRSAQSHRSRRHASRRRIFSVSPRRLRAEEAACAKKIISTLAPRAYRQAVGPSGPRHAAELLSERPRQQEPSTTASSRRWRAFWSIRALCSASNANRPASPPAQPYPH